MTNPNQSGSSGLYAGSTWTPIPPPTPPPTPWVYVYPTPQPPQVHVHVDDTDALEALDALAERMTAELDGVAAFLNIEIEKLHARLDEISARLER